MKTNTNSTPKKRSTTPLVWGIILPFFLVGGMVMLIMGAVNHIGALLGVGIAMVVVGFYGTPLVWVQYGSKRQYDRVVQTVMIDNVLNVPSISAHTGIKENDVYNHVKKAIQLGDVKGLTLNGNTLQSIDTITSKDNGDVVIDVTCPNCGGTTTLTNTTRSRCAYCGKMIEKKD